MPLSRRYRPEIMADDVNVFGYDFSPIIPPGVGIKSANVAVNYNVQPPLAANGELTTGEVSWRDRTVYATVTATEDAFGKDFQLVWTAETNDGGIWVRTALIACAQTS